MFRQHQNQTLCDLKTIPQELNYLQTSLCECIVLRKQFLFSG